MRVGGKGPPPYELENPFLMKLVTVQREPSQKRPGQSLLPSARVPSTSPPLQARKVGDREQCAAGPGALCKGDACNPPPGAHPKPSLPADPRETRRQLFFPCTKQRRRGGPHRARAPVRPTRAPGTPPRALTCRAGAPGLPAAHRPRGPRGQKGGGRVPEGRAWAAGARRARGRASFLLLPTRVRVGRPPSSSSPSRPRGKGP